MKAKEYKKMVEAGKDVLVEFVDHQQLGDSGTHFEKGMRAYLKAVVRVDSEIFCMHFDETKHREYNKQLETPIWMDNKTGEYSLRFSESHDLVTYKGIETIYEGATDDIVIFKLVEEGADSLYLEYTAQETVLPYIGWLEKQVMEGRQKKPSH